MPPVKPLGRKAYGSIPHLPGSRTGPGDWFLSPAQAALAVGSTRPGDRVVVTEKADGSCCSVARMEGRIVPLLRAGYRAEDSHFAQHHVFADWARAHEELFLRLLGDGERAVGEWLLVAHGTRYRIENDLDLFPVFDIFTPGRDRGLPERRVPHDELAHRLAAAELPGAPVLCEGPAISVPAALELLGPFGRHHALEEPEGVVYRVETDGKFNFLAKYVKPGKCDGRYLPDVEGSVSDVFVPNGPAAERWIAGSDIGLRPGG